MIIYENLTGETININQKVDFINCSNLKLTLEWGKLFEVYGLFGNKGIIIRGNNIRNKNNFNKVYADYLITFKNCKDIIIGTGKNFIYLEDDRMIVNLIKTNVFFTKSFDWDSELIL